MQNHAAKIHNSGEELERKHKLLEDKFDGQNSGNSSQIAELRVIQGSMQSKSDKQEKDLSAIKNAMTSSEEGVKRFKEDSIQKFVSLQKENEQGRKDLSDTKNTMASLEGNLDQFKGDSTQKFFSLQKANEESKAALVVLSNNQNEMNKNLEQIEKNRKEQFKTTSETISSLAQNQSALDHKIETNNKNFVGALEQHKKNHEETKSRMIKVEAQTSQQLEEIKGSVKSEITQAHSEFSNLLDEHKTTTEGKLGNLDQEHGLLHEKCTSLSHRIDLNDQAQIKQNTEIIQLSKDLSQLSEGQKNQGNELSEMIRTHGETIHKLSECEKELDQNLIVIKKETNESISKNGVELEQLQKELQNQAVKISETGKELERKHKLLEEKCDGQNVANNKQVDGLREIQGDLKSKTDKQEEDLSAIKSAVTSLEGNLNQFKNDSAQNSINLQKENEKGKAALVVLSSNQTEMNKNLEQIEKNRKVQYETTSETISSLAQKQSALEQKFETNNKNFISTLDQYKENISAVINTEKAETSRRKNEFETQTSQRLNEINSSVKSEFTQVRTDLENSLNEHKTATESRFSSLEGDLKATNSSLNELNKANENNNQRMIKLTNDTQQSLETIRREVNVTIKTNTQALEVKCEKMVDLNCTILSGQIEETKTRLNDQVENLGQKLSQTSNDHKVKSKEIDTKLAQHTDEIQQILKKTDNLVGTLDNYQKDTNTLKTQSEILLKSIDKASEGQKSITRRLDEHENAIGGLKNDSASVKKEFNEFRGKSLADSKKFSKEINELREGNKNELQKVDNELATLKDKTVILDKSLQRLQTENNKVTEELKETSTRIHQSQQVQDEFNRDLQFKLSSRKNEIMGVELHLQTANTQITQLIQQQSSLKSQQTTFEGDLTTVTAHLGQLDVEKEGLKNDVSVLQIKNSPDRKEFIAREKRE